MRILHYLHLSVDNPGLTAIIWSVMTGKEWPGGNGAQAGASRQLRIADWELARSTGTDSGFNAKAQRRSAASRNQNAESELRIGH